MEYNSPKSKLKDFQNPEDIVFEVIQNNRESYYNDVLLSQRDSLEVFQQGVKKWNTNRVCPVLKNIPHFNAIVSLCMNLDNLNLSKLNLDGIDLSRISMQFSNLQGSSLIYANLCDSHMEESDFSEAILFGADLSITYCYRTLFIKTDIRWAQMSISNANLEGADLRQATILTMSHVNFKNTILGGTVFKDVDFSTIDNLKTVIHTAPSPISTASLIKSKGKIPKLFLRGCGLEEWEIESCKLYNPDLSSYEIAGIQNDVFQLRSKSPIAINPVFISYASQDEVFVKSLEIKLTESNIRYWRDKHDMKAGNIETQIERGINLSPIFIIILSKSSTKSDWVQWEAKIARDHEKREKRDVLCPISLDNSWKTCAWTSVLKNQMEKYHILDFSEWREESELIAMYQKLVSGLKENYQYR